MHDLWQDVRYGVRVLGRARGFTAVVVLILGIGIGASTILFTAINGVLLRPLPYVAPDRLVALRESNAAQPAERASVSAPNFVDWSAQTRAMEGLAAFRSWGFVLTGADEPERVVGARVSDNLFSLLGVRPLRGRTLVPGDARPGSHRVVLLSEGLWRRRFGADPGLVGQAVTLDGEPYTVVGILRGDFDLPTASLWVPLVFAPYELEQRGNRALSVVGRMKPGVDLHDAREEMNAVARTLGQWYPEADAGWSVTITPLQRDLVGPARTPLLLLFGATCALLLVTCANLANLLLVRNAARRPELALRAAVGADRRRLVRQLATEALLLVAAGGGLGLVLASLGTDLLTTLGAAFVPRRAVRIDAVVVGFVALASALIGLGLATILAVDVTRLNLDDWLRSGSTVRTSRVARAGPRDFLVTGQVAVALSLLVGAGLLVRSLLRAQSVDPGFIPSRVLSVTIALSGSRYPTGGQRVAFFAGLTERLGALPGIRSTGLVSHLPLAGGALSGDFRIAGRPPLATGEIPIAQLLNIDPHYFRAMGIPLQRGRSFTTGDGSNGGAVVIIDETLADRYWPSEDPVGQRVRVGATLGADSGWRVIVGVVAGVRSLSLEREPAPTIYVPYAQNPWPSMTLVVHGDAESDPGQLAGAARAAVRALDPDQPVSNVRSLDEVVDRAAASRRFGTLLLGGFATAALSIAVFGVYGVLAHAVARRTRELGIRVALGAQSRDVLTLILRQATVRLATGFLIGATAAAVGSRVLANLLFEVSPWDPVAFVGAAAVLAIAGFAASYLPARQAARLDPVLALRRD